MDLFPGRMFVVLSSFRRGRGWLCGHSLVLEGCHLMAISINLYLCTSVVLKWNTVMWNVCLSALVPAGQILLDFPLLPGECSPITVWVSTLDIPCAAGSTFACQPALSQLRWVSVPAALDDDKNQLYKTSKQKGDNNLNGTILDRHSIRLTYHNISFQKLGWLYSNADSVLMFWLYTT